MAAARGCGGGVLLVLISGAVAPDGCPLLVPRSQAVFQPVRLPPEAVARKNAGGCLSAADALYGADGCPSRLCPPARPDLEL